MQTILGKIHARQHKVCLTAESTAPGFWVRIDLITWNTSTTPSVLHTWVTMVMAQNMPDLPTVSLDWDEEASCDLT